MRNTCNELAHAALVLSGFKPCGSKPSMKLLVTTSRPHGDGREHEHKTPPYPRAEFWGCCAWPHPCAIPSPRMDLVVRSNERCTRCCTKRAARGAARSALHEVLHMALHEAPREALRDVLLDSLRVGAPGTRRVLNHLTHATGQALQSEMASEHCEEVASFIFCFAQATHNQICRSCARMPALQLSELSSLRTKACASNW